MSLPIKTERLLVRRYGLEDVDDILAWIQHPSVAGETKEIEGTEEGVRAYIERWNARLGEGGGPREVFQKGKWVDLAIERRRDGRVIGMLSMVRNQHRQGEIGWALGVDYRSQGYASEAAAALIQYGFSVLKLHRFQSQTNSKNTDSWRLMERLGMRQEARLREAVDQDGEWLDRLIYGVLAREWPKDAT
jgi:RimJ/RimL family protein N-acetyltransferase